MKKKAMAGIVVLIAAALVLAACGTPEAPAAPTADANAVYTQAAATVAAGLTQTAASNPTATYTPAAPTNTPTMIEPTSDAQAAAATQLAGTQAAGNTTPAATAASGVTPVPTATRAVSGGTTSTTGDVAEWISQSPPDGTEIEKNATFNVTFTLKNTGTTTWTKAYTFRFYAGDQLKAPNDTNLLQDVAPGEQVTILFTMIGPDSAKETNSVFVMTNAEGKNFYSVFLKLKFK